MGWRELARACRGKSRIVGVRASRTQSAGPRSGPAGKRRRRVMKHELWRCGGRQEGCVRAGQCEGLKIPALKLF
jgi:hypothetical protein